MILTDAPLSMGVRAKMAHGGGYSVEEQMNRAYLMSDCEYVDEEQQSYVPSLKVALRLLLAFDGGFSRLIATTDMTMRAYRYNYARVNRLSGSRCALSSR